MEQWESCGAFFSSPATHCTSHKAWGTELICALGIAQLISKPLQKKKCVRAETHPPVPSHLGEPNKQVGLPCPLHVKHYRQAKSKKLCDTSSQKF